MAHLDRAGTALPQPSPSSCSRAAFPCWDEVAAAARVCQGRCEERGLPWQEQQLCSVPCGLPVPWPPVLGQRDRPALEHRIHTAGRWVFPTGHTSTPLEVKRGFPAGKSKRLLFPSTAGSGAALVPKALVSQCCDRHGQRVPGVF